MVVTFPQFVCGVMSPYPVDQTNVNSIERGKRTGGERKLEGRGGKGEGKWGAQDEGKRDSFILLNV